MSELNGKPFCGFSLHVLIFAELAGANSLITPTLLSRHPVVFLILVVTPSGLEGLFLIRRRLSVFAEISENIAVHNTLTFKLTAKYID